MSVSKIVAATKEKEQKLKILNETLKEVELRMNDDCGVDADNSQMEDAVLFGDILNDSRMKVDSLQVRLHFTS